MAERARGERGADAFGEAIARARPLVVAALAARLRDLDLAEDAFGTACEALLTGSVRPDDVAAWLYVAARRRAIDRLRVGAREAVGWAALAWEQDMKELADPPDPFPDERLRLIFICCHPAIAPEMRLALTLRLVCGVEVADLARAFVLGEPAMYQRITRAKAKIRAAGISFDTPLPRHWPGRLGSVLSTLEIAFSVAYRDSAGGEAQALAGEVYRLASILAQLLPDESEAQALAAVVGFAHARRAARIDAGGAMVPFSRQDRALWDDASLAEARRWLCEAARSAKRGPYLLLASIHAVHCARAATGETDWREIAALYDELAVLRPTQVVAINRAVALGRAFGAECGLAALAEVDAGRMTAFLPYQAARADLLASAGDKAGARAALDAALALAPGQAEARYLSALRTDLAED